jgi:hypothetical protein
VLILHCLHVPRVRVQVTTIQFVEGTHGSILLQQVADIKAIHYNAYDCIVVARRAGRGVRIGSVATVCSGFIALLFRCTATALGRPENSEAIHSGDEEA